MKYMCLGYVDETMVQDKEICLIALKGIAMLVMLSTAWQAMAQNAKTTYPNMAPVDQYLMEDRSSEIAWPEVRRQSPYHAMRR